MAVEPDRSCCATGHLHSGKPKGEVTKIGEIPAYIAKSGKNDGKVLVIITDVFGWELVNSQLLADQYAEAGITTYVPDFHAGEPLRAEEWDPIMVHKAPGFCGRVMGGLRFAASLPSMLSWFGRHGEVQTLPILETVLTALRAQSDVNRIAVMGYCWGGKYSLLMGHKGPIADKVDVVAAAHPSWVKMPGDIEGIVKPAFIACAGQDGIFPASAVATTRKIFEDKNKLDGRLDLTIVEYKGTSHGFAVRGDENDPVVSAARAEVLKATAAFFLKHL